MTWGGVSTHHATVFTPAVFPYNKGFVGNACFLNS